MENNTEQISETTIESSEVTTSETPIVETKSFLDTLPENLKNEPSLKDFKDINGLANSYINANKMLGNRISVPNDKSTPEEWNKFYSKLGRPEAIDKYTIPEGLEETELLTNFKQLAFDKGLNDKQFNEIVDMFNNYEKGLVENNTKEYAKFEEDFKNKFQDKSEEVLKNSKNTFEKYGDEEDFAIFDTLNSTQTIALAKMFDKMSNVNMKEGTLVSGKSSNKNLQEVMERMEAIKSKDMFYNENKEYIDLAQQKRDLFTSGAKLY